MIKKRGILLPILLFTLFLVSNVSSQESASEKGFQWLNSKSVSGSWNDKVFDTSLAIIALSDAGLSTNAEEGAFWLLTQQDPEGCFPKGDCKVRETAFALIALDKTSKDTSKIVDWLLNDAQTPIPTTGKWWLQIATSADGSCLLTYEESNVTFTENITIKDNKVTNCNNEPWFDLRACIANNPLARNPSLQFNVDCTTLPGSPIISSIYNRGSSYYILQEVHSSSALLDVESGCWGIAKRTSCDYESSLYATYALNQVGVLSSSIIWLRDNYQPAVTLHNSLLYATTGKDFYLNTLLQLQDQEGSWNQNVYQTSFSILALKESQKPEALAKSIGWLKSKQGGDGSWNNDVVQTSLALWSGFTEERVSCGDGFCDRGEENTCPRDCELPTARKGGEVCFNSVDDDGDAYIDCEDPDCLGDIACEELEVCDDSVDNDFDGFIDCEDSDCSGSIACGEREICNDGKDNDDDGLTDCDDVDCEFSESCPLKEKEGRSLAWLWIILIILIIAGVLFYFYKKDPENFKNNLKKPFTKEFWKGLFKKKPKTIDVQRPTFRYPQRGLPQKPQTYQPYQRTKTEDELSKSLREARKLLRKK